MKIQEMHAGSTELRSLRAVSLSSGNHAQGLAKAARSCGISSTIVLPNNTLDIKIKAIESYGAEVVLCPLSLQVGRPLYYYRII